MRGGLRIDRFRDVARATRVHGVKLIPILQLHIVVYVYDVVARVTRVYGDEISKF